MMIMDRSTAIIKTNELSHRQPRHSRDVAYTDAFAVDMVHHLVIGFGEINNILLEFLNNTSVINNGRSLFCGHEFG